MKLPAPLAFKWDKGNLKKNWGKHKIYFKEIEEVFFNRPIKFFQDKKHSNEEKRFIALGKTNKQTKLIIIFIVRNKKIRIISARKQSKKERSIYEK